MKMKFQASSRVPCVPSTRSVHTHTRPPVLIVIPRSPDHPRDSENGPGRRGTWGGGASAYTRGRRLLIAIGVRNRPFSSFVTVVTTTTGDSQKPGNTAPYRISTGATRNLDGWGVDTHATIGPSPDPSSRTPRDDKGSSGALTTTIHPVWSAGAKPRGRVGRVRVEQSESAPSARGRGYPLRWAPTRGWSHMDRGGKP